MQRDARIGELVREGQTVLYIVWQGDVIEGTEADLTADLKALDKYVAEEEEGMHAAIAKAEVVNERALESPRGNWS